MKKHAWEVEFYKTESGKSPVLDFIRALPKPERAEIGWGIDDLERLGPMLRMPLSRPLISKENLFELRITGEDNIYRVLYFHFTGRKFVLVHAFVKKVQKTPDKELKIALERLKDYKARHK